jgi:hypothetical protein
MLKDCRKRRTTAVRERIRPGFAIVRDESLHSMDCIACAVMPTAAWSMPVPAQNSITRSSALSFVVAFAIADFSPLYVRFALIATELMRRSELVAECHLLLDAPQQTMRGCNALLDHLVGDGEQRRRHGEA